LGRGEGDLRRPANLLKAGGFEGRRRTSGRTMRSDGALRGPRSRVRRAWKPHLCEIMARSVSRCDFFVWRFRLGDGPACFTALVVLGDRRHSDGILHWNVTETSDGRIGSPAQQFRMVILSWGKTQPPSILMSFQDPKAKQASNSGGLGFFSHGGVFFRGPGGAPRFSKTSPSGRPKPNEFLRKTADGTHPTGVPDFVDFFPRCNAEALAVGAPAMGSHITTAGPVLTRALGARQFRTRGPERGSRPRLHVATPGFSDGHSTWWWSRFSVASPSRVTHSLEPLKAPRMEF